MDEFVEVVEMYTSVHACMGMYNLVFMATYGCLLWGGVFVMACVRACVCMCVLVCTYGVRM